MRILRNFRVGPTYKVELKTWKKEPSSLAWQSQQWRARYFWEIHVGTQLDSKPVRVHSTEGLSLIFVTKSESSSEVLVAKANFGIWRKYIYIYSFIFCGTHSKPMRSWKHIQKQNQLKCKCPKWKVSIIKIQYTIRKYLGKILSRGAEVIQGKPIVGFLSEGSLNSRESP